MKTQSISAILLIAAISSFYSNKCISQATGFINRQATSAGGRAILDPNGDGYTSISTAGFGNNDVTNSEIPYKGVRSYVIEPNSDLRRGPNHGYSDFVPDSAGDGFYYHFTAAQNMLFRFRMGGIMPGSKGYSVLMDTDGKFGATGPNADPNYFPSTNGTNGNPGFEIEVVLETNFRIAIYNVDGTSSPAMIKQYTNWQDMSQISLAVTNDNGDPDFLVDFYIPFSDLQGAPFNLTTGSTIRMTATTVMMPGAATGGPRSDIYGVSTDNYENFINGQPVCSIFNTAPVCPTAMCTNAPTINSPIGTGTVNISGTWTKSTLNGASSTANITVYKNAVSVGTVNNVSSGSTWTFNGIVLSNGDVITAKAVATGETMCFSSNTVTASACNVSNLPATPVLTCTSGSKGITGTNLSSGWTIHVDNTTRSVFENSVANTGGLFGSTSGSSPNITWLFSSGCSGGSNITSGSYKIYYTDNVTGCVSLPAYFCAAGNAVNALAGSLTAPTITTPSNAVFTTATTSISGTTDANASLYLYIDNINVQNTTASAGGTFTFSGLTLLAGQQLYIVVELNTGTVGTSKCSSQTITYTVGCYTTIPLINADNNNQITAGSPITGTSSEPAGTSIKVYNSSNALMATTTVQANGTWSSSPYNAVAGTSYYANAQNGTCTVSVNSATFAAAAITLSARCGTITGPVSSGAASIGGTLTGSLASTTVNLYLDGQLIGSSVTSGTNWGPITVNSTASNTLYSNGVLSIGIQESGKQEVECPASFTTITCTPMPVTPLYSPANSTINQYHTITYTISNAVSGSFYAFADSATGQSLGQGKWASSNGSLSITTNTFNTPGTYKVIVRSSSLSGVTQCSSVSSTALVTVNPGTLPLTLLEFKGKKQTEGNLLEWVTGRENQLNRFEMERSTNGYVYNKIGQLPAAGNSNVNRSYSFTDDRPSASVNYYRLKMIDNNGKYSYSNTIALSSSSFSGSIVSSVSPNPFTESITVNVLLENPESLDIQITDFTGRTMFTREVKGKKGNNPILLSGLGKLSTGIYFIRIKTPESMLVQKVLKK